MRDSRYEYEDWSDEELFDEQRRLQQVIRNRREERGECADEPVRVKVVLLDDEARNKLRNGICEFLDDVFGAAITWGIWGGLIGYWVYCYYH